jgi:hypothetical protein
MESMTSGEVAERGCGWRWFFFMLAMFFAAFFLTGFVPTPRAGSDIRSKWLNAAADTAVCIIFLVAVVRGYFASGSLAGLQATVLGFIFSVFLAGAAFRLVESIRFLQELRGQHSGTAVGPNHWVQATPGCAFLFVVSHWPGAPDPAR